MKFGKRHEHDTSDTADLKHFRIVLFHFHFTRANIGLLETTAIGPLQEKISQCPGRSVKNPRNIWKMTPETDFFSRWQHVDNDSAGHIRNEKRRRKA